MDIIKYAQAVLALSAAALIGGCATNPPSDADIAISNAAINGALNAGAGDAAPLELRTAREKLDHARQEREAGHGERAIVLAREATVDARLAESKALAARSTKSAEDLHDANRALAEEVNRKASSN